ncbi:MAG: serine O-acetyltransferase [Coriobacteriia bacterium]|nr:serine O-acetyltransferase [Coriobacteriia bacterium]MCL2750288.1 serine O-acetyltransferase [Coriobacteriia bacterium]
MISRIREDIRAARERDPAAPSAAGVLINYPGVHAVAAHRCEHYLWKQGRRGLARFMSQCTRFFTGVEIHPGATLGRRVFIDHGMGVIIGETAVVGNNVTIFQGVTLGGTGKQTGKRHPNVEDWAVLGVGSAVLGNVTVGARSKVGAGAVVVDNVPPDSTVVGIPGRIVRQDGVRVSAADLSRLEPLPYPLEEDLLALTKRVEDLENQGMQGMSNEQLEQILKRLDSLEAELNTLDAAIKNLGA